MSLRKEAAMRKAADIFKKEIKTNDGAQRVRVYEPE